MPPRLNKRQAREQAELEALQAAAAASAGPESTEQEEEENESDEPPAREPKSAFAALSTGQDDEPEEDESEEEQQVVTKKKSKSKKKKKKKAAEPVGDSATTDTPPSVSTPDTSATRSSKKGGNKASAKSLDDMDEIDRALAELAKKGGASGASGDAASSATPIRLEPKWQALKEIFSFDPKFLDSDAELRRMFGSKVINTSPAAPRSMHHARFANNPHHSTSIKRNPTYLANPEAGWHSPSGVLSLSRYDGPEARDPNDAGGEWWTYQHSQRYREGQLGFLEVLQQADGNRLFQILQSHPYHVDTLMQLSEMMNQQGDQGASSTWLSKALYALSAPLPPSFPSGSFRLPYSQIENRAFFLAIARKVAMLVKRGTWRTACEWAKIGLGAGGNADPVGMLLFIDFLAPKAKQGAWYLSLLKALPEAYPHMCIEGYPGLAYGKALVLRGMEEDANEDDTKSTAALRSAILRFPMVVPLLFTSLGGNAPPNLLSNRRAQVDGNYSTQPSYILSLLSELYCARSSPLWKEPPVLAWLQKTVNSAAPAIDDSSEEDVRIGERLWSKGVWEAGYAPAGIIRAAFISDIASIRPYLPPAATSGTSYSYDPLPPPRSVATFYDDAYFAPLYGAGGRRGRRVRVSAQRGGGNARGAAANAAAQLAQFLGLGEGGNGAPIELNDELREQLMAELHQLAREGRGEGELPGGFPGAEEEDEDDEDLSDDELPQDPAAAQNLLGRLAALFGGGGAQPPAPA